MPRTWADIPISRVCRTFRKLAVEYYGVPQQHVVPFNPKLDILVIQGEKVNLVGHPSAMDGVAYAPNLNLQNWSKDSNWLLHDGVHSINDFPIRVRPWSKIAKMSAEFLERPRRVVLDVDDGTLYSAEDWAQILNFIGKTFANTQVFKVNVCSIDECGGIGRGEDVDDHYRGHDIHLFGGLAWAVQQSSASTFFPNLETLEVEKVGEYCSSTLSEKSFEAPPQLRESLLRELS